MTSQQTFVPRPVTAKLGGPHAASPDLGPGLWFHSSLSVEIHSFTACFRGNRGIATVYNALFCTVFLIAEVTEYQQASILPVVVGRVVLPSQAPPYASAHQLVARAVHGVPVQRLRLGKVVYGPMP